MGHCIIHVGMYKTGTTSIQRSLDRFADERFAYADLAGHPNHTRAIYGVLGFDSELAPAGWTGSGAEGRFRRAMDEAGGRSWIISGEGIVRVPPERLEALRTTLASVFDGITIVAAVREPAGYMAGAFQTRLRRVATDVPRSLVRYRPYRDMFAKFDRIFGRENVRLWKFDPASYPGGCAVRDFCSRLGIALPEERIVRLNDSLSREAVGLLYIYRLHGIELGSRSMTAVENLELSDALSNIGQKRFRISPDAIAPVLEKHRRDIDWMENRLGQSLRGDMGAHRPGDVRGESDLLEPDPAAVDALLATLGNSAPGNIEGRTPQEVARLVHALRLKVSGPAPRSPLKARVLGALKRVAAPFRKRVAHQ